VKGKRKEKGRKRKG